MKTTAKTAEAKAGTAPADDTGADDAPVSERMCIVTRQHAEPDQLIRFVAAPDGSVVADLKRSLPGRGCSVSARRDLVEKAIKKNLFARALRRDVTPAPDLADQLDRLLVQNLAGMINLARKAGQLVSGATKVDNAVRSGEAVAVFHATDAADDGVRKISQARKAWSMMMDEEEDIPVFRLLSFEEMRELMGDNAFIHAVVLAGQAGEGVVKRAKLLESYRGGEA
ncbi:RNA-binding protein [Rhizobium alvei]|uniref:RNA-binding protein n=1 Tax=Rhizobium alvei TaxID=1132659 RepID=UPI0036183712